MIRRAERKSYKWVGIAAAVLLLAAVLVFGLRIKEVSVSGSNRYTPEQIASIKEAAKQTAVFFTFNMSLVSGIKHSPTDRSLLWRNIRSFFMVPLRQR